MRCHLPSLFKLNARRAAEAQSLVLSFLCVSAALREFSWINRGRRQAGNDKLWFADKCLFQMCGFARRWLTTGKTDLVGHPALKLHRFRALKLANGAG